MMSRKVREKYGFTPLSPLRKSLFNKTWHVLKQVEWYKRLKKEYNCFFVAMEYREKIHQKNSPSEKRVSIIYDVYGKTLDGKIFIVEIGNIDKHKLKYLQKYQNSRENVKFLYEPKPILSIMQKFIDNF